MELTTVWFLLIGVLWAGYFLLEGFDFGVGILLPVVGRDERSRRLAINTIGPVWDGNEVWLLVAGGATFAAFPEWYATLFSGFFLPLLLILVALIVRGVAFEYRGKRDGALWRKRWDIAIFVGSLVPAILWGVAFGNILRGVRLDARHEYVGGFFDLLNPYALLGGLTTLVLFTLHGAVFLALKTDGPMRAQSGRLASQLSLAAVPVAAGFLLWTGLAHTDGWGIALSAAAALALLAAIPLTRARREGWAFAATGATLLLAVAALFVTLFPDVMPSTIDPAYSLTVHNASSTPYTLKVMTWVAVFFTPIVLIYQGWTYWVFRKRLKLSDIPA
ncbi:cytochrome d ubiquinol oxidase subunit II [Actinoplanes teichomyceticus]|uniref:Cytochrome bd-I ubiquinol oxidase subunit 2 apoprotein n=1 Tax=Actinoplanes teichomyceticus TaxID=1867 RepID=A0A561WLS5_ACTTI|nr:cytochrome d ubiquinol oxidase subunit II [Actinoplanes teichomyceticus]TWG24816.1 cytochrome bd-I ubiquinol oxidase subunit 2 apoprotein [Actinoplanes teichomyceticus]GIF15651.1 cytochrome c oxidase assembly protein [Actinoplanes teichomyceticus]